ncbi:hypothetical protein Nepgr_018158 [Nepenthes gracilis]|uniref:Uncharacterized protein n=1 Tax=Nepenthes gracilis TaxID=150966 RepID=A0AAD3XSU2_NEPGR|nr:hypothetical protein Nepgr_018158 [Nepenthes gracilis]
MSSTVESIPKRSFLPAMSGNLSLPVSQADMSKDRQQRQGGLRRRLSSLSLKIGPVCSATDPWAFPRSKSLSSIGQHAGNSIAKWWDWGWAWIHSRKPGFARDLEMNEEEKHMLGFQSKGSWRHVFYKLKAELRRICRSDNNSGQLPQTFRYNSFDYSKNFDDGLESKY